MSVTSPEDGAAEEDDGSLLNPGRRRALGAAASLGALLTASDAGAAVELGRMRPENKPRRPNACFGCGDFSTGAEEVDDSTAAAVVFLIPLGLPKRPRALVEDS